MSTNKHAVWCALREEESRVMGKATIDLVQMGGIFYLEGFKAGRKDFRGKKNMSPADMKSALSNYVQKFENEATSARHCDEFEDLFYMVGKVMGFCSALCGEKN